MAFSIKARIGRGRTVETFQAVLEVGRESMEVAVKRPRPEFVHNARFSAALIDWGIRHKEVEHPSIVGILEAGGAQESAYVIQELVDGASLAQLMEALRRKRRSFTVPVALAIAERVASGLEHLHDRKMVHGAIDPHEILISSEGAVRLGDEGLHQLDVHIGTDLHDDPGESLLYQPPEVRPQTVGTRPAEDVWALALVVVEMLIGHAVWRKPPMTVEGAIGALKDFTHIGHSQPALTQDLVEILAASTHTDPASRVPAGRELAAGLRRMIGKHRLVTDARAIGSFVAALMPTMSVDDAPTMMVDARGRPPSVPELPNSQLEYLSIAIDPDLEQKAVARSGPSPRVLAHEGACGAIVATPAELTLGPQASEAPTVPPSAGGPASPDQGRPVPVAPSVIQERSPSRPAPQRPISALSQVVMAAERASKESASKRFQWQLYTGIAIIVLIVVMMIVHMLTREARVVHLTATSVPTHAALYVDDQWLGETPVDTSVALTHRKVHLAFKLGGYETYDVTFETREDLVHYEAVLRPLAK
jgi:serine/threonine protein kinase